MSFYYLLGYRSFKNDIEIKKIVLKYIKEHEAALDIKNESQIRLAFSDAELMNASALLIFNTAKQQTWIVSCKGYVFCLLDDIELDIKNDFQLIKWYAKKDEIVKVIKTRPSQRLSDKIGLVDFGERHKNWYYSKRLLSNEEMAETFIKDTIISGSSS